MLTPQTFNELLEKSIFCGRIEVWNKGARGDFEAIVAEELFDRVQVVLRVSIGGAAGPHVRHNPDFPAPALRQVFALFEATHWSFSTGLK